MLIVQGGNPLRRSGPYDHYQVEKDQPRRSGDWPRRLRSVSDAKLNHVDTIDAVDNGQLDCAVTRDQMVRRWNAMFEPKMDDLEKAMLPVARFSLALFAAFATIHLLAFAQWLVLPAGMLFIGLPLILPGQIVVIAGLISSSQELRTGRLGRADRWRITWCGLRVIPWWWVVIFALLFYGYAPWTVLVHATRFHGMVENANGQCLLVNRGEVVRALDPSECLAARAGEAKFLTLGGMCFSLVHYLVLGYALPLRRQIVIAALGGSSSAC